MSARLALVAAVLGFAVWIMAPTGSRTQETASGDQEGVQVEARGPVHEAFAEPTIRGPRATPIVPKEPPAPIDELPPDQKPEGDNVVWIPGYWAWDADRNDFLWVSGIYRAVPPGRSWVPGRWNQAGGGWQWVPGYWAEEATQNQPEQAGTGQAGTEQGGSEVEYLPPPPDPVAESAPPAPTATDVYVPGTWVYRDVRYRWRPGFYVSYRQGWVWIPAHYVWTPAGYVFVEGYWDFALSDRGLLFAPVYLSSRLYSQPGWSYQPSYTVPVPFLMGCLFVRADTCHYFFGDYFEAAYQRAGYVSWIDFRVGQRFYDPLFEYYRFAHRDNPAWYHDLRAVYIGRQEGRIARPPRNLLQQTTLVRDNRITTINNITVNNITNINSITNVAPLASLSQVQAARIVKLQTLSRNQLQAERQAVHAYQNVVTARAKIEQQVISRGSPLRTGAQAAPVRMNLPVPAAIRRTSMAVKAPPRPAALGRAQPSGRATQPPEERNIQPAERGRPVTPTQPSPEMRREPQPPATTERRPETPPTERRPPTQVLRETRPGVPPTERPPAATERRIEPPPVERRPPTQPPAAERRIEPPPAERRPPTPPPAERRPPTPPPAAERRAPEPKPPERRPPPPEKKPPEKPKEKPPEK
jgi:hypothetical protein